MPSGSCLCGNIKIKYTAEPAVKAICHCADCQKMSGSAYSVNHVVPGEGFEYTGTPKVFSKAADSGQNVNSMFCGDCGSTLWRETGSFPGMKVVKVGVIDGKGEGLHDGTPSVELYAPERVSWVPKLAGSDDKTGMS